MDYKNFEYIVASLPVLEADDRNISPAQSDSIIEEIRENLRPKDILTLDLLLDLYNSDKICSELYIKALKSKNRFIREFFSFDLALRNAKTEYLNEELGREKGQDTIALGQEEEEVEEVAKATEIFHDNDILRRERSLDELSWEKIDSIVSMDIFSLDYILSCVAKLKIIERWTVLDPETGRSLFRKLVEEIRGSR